MSSIAEIKKVFASTDLSDYDRLFEEYAGDDREGVKKILESAHRKRKHTMMRRSECTRCSSTRESIVIMSLSAV